MTFARIVTAASLMSVLPGFALAQEAPALVPTDVVWIMNTFLLDRWFLVFFMACGFAMLEADLFGQKRHDAAYEKTWASL